ncbi:glycosyltransferase family 2 protein [Komagataeibacter intermedius]|uniref:Glycosyl transferase family 2 n=2 Tax=Komagataeibacter intermedius TaxID=66229 RepID=A0A0N1N4H8_9PROT|nr:glycosyltransferase family 2 protein [Komagataeibacter intermedius]KPH85482.1 glycosyl transferase family 2 [Komagataeibacter intermedius AF2]MCF3637603.1 glycosyltransferase family 2 protein [Komagataeibacter intermedius]
MTDFISIKNKNTMSVVVLVPCYNEETTVFQVVSDFRKYLPDAVVYVYDNNSTDNTVRRALDAGAIVRQESMPGKGNVVRRMFADIDADFYILVDGDATYDAAAAPEMLALASGNGLDMVNGARVSTATTAYRPGHVLGNKIFTLLVRSVFGKRISDILSGYRVFSRRFVKSFPALSSGFETETEFSIHALDLRMPIGEIRTRYFERPTGSQSKLNTWKDGFRIMALIFNLIKLERPLVFFSTVAVVLLCLSLMAGMPVIIGWLHTGLVPRLPTALLATGFIILSALSFTCGLILDVVYLARTEAKRLAYLAQPSPTLYDTARSLTAMDLVASN